MATAETLAMARLAIMAASEVPNFLAGLLPFYGIDGSPLQGNQYTVTVTQAGGAGNGTLNQALITVDEVLAGG